MTDDSSLQVGCSAEVIDDFSGDHVLHQGIYGKVPPLRRFLRTEEGICKDFKIPVSPSGGFFPSGHCNIKVVSLQAVYAEVGTDFRRLSEIAENLFQLLRSDAVDFHIDVLIFPSQNFIPDKASYKISAAAFLRCQRGDTIRHFQIFSIFLFCCCVHPRVFLPFSMFPVPEMQILQTSVLSPFRASVFPVRNC